MKTFREQKYPIAIRVLLTDEDGWTAEDAIKGLNIGHALYMARMNWEGFTPTFIGMYEEGCTHV